MKEIKKILVKVEKLMNKVGRLLEEIDLKISIDPDKYVDDNVLKIAVDGESNTLLIGYFIGKVWMDIGVITKTGECHIINTYDRVQHYNKWMDTNKDHYHDSQTWRGGEYQLITGNNFCSLIRMDIQDGYIYDFGLCVAVNGCLDDNIKRIPGLDKPILF